MTIRDYSDNIILVALPPEPYIRDQLDKVMEIASQGTSNVVIDFAQVDIMTSLAFSGFLRLHQLLTDSGRRLVFFNVAPLTKELFNVTCFDNIFEFVDDLDAAAATINQTPITAKPAAVILNPQTVAEQ